MTEQAGVTDQPKHVACCANFYNEAFIQQSARLGLGSCLLHVWQLHAEACVEYAMTYLNFDLVLLSLWVPEV